MGIHNDYNVKDEDSGIIWNIQSSTSTRYYTETDIRGEGLSLKGGEVATPKEVYKGPRKEKPSYNIFDLEGSLSGSSRRAATKYPSKDLFMLDECLEVFRELQNKDIGDIYLSGSVGLYIQGKLDRKEFKDLDIVIIGNIELDDEIADFPRGDYPDDDNRRSVLFNGIPIDIFTSDKVNKNVVITESGEYQCQHYSDIVQEKLIMAFDHLKDKDYLLANVLDIKIL